MKNIDSRKLRQMWNSFFEKKGHAAIGSASVIPENDPTVLFTTAGMHPLVPYLLGEKHPAGKRLCNVQKCIRTGDIDEVGDASHCTFFEMLGNWSLGDYFKAEQIPWSWEFLTSPEYLGIEPSSLAFTVFAGDGDCARDEESAKLWLSCGVKKERVFYLPKKNNWWGPAGITGPCGPDTEMFIVKDVPDCSPDCSPACDCGKYLEIWNDVFMQYFKNAEGGYEPLSQRNVDTGMGLERTLCVLQGKASVYETDVFVPIIKKIEELSGKEYGGELTRPIRIVADHVRTAVHMIGDRRGIVCSNVAQGYILRRLLRRAVRYGKRLDMERGSLALVAETVIGVYAEYYPELAENRQKIIDEINLEEERFEKTLLSGLRNFEKLVGGLKNAGKDIVSGNTAFKLYATFGFPIEMTEELAAEQGLATDREGFEKAFEEHQRTSQDNSGQDFKGGLADHTEKTVALHTATHLLHRALKNVLDDENVNQKGSNITAERLRLDFTFDRPMTQEELQRAEDMVNKAITDALDVTCEEMSVEDARARGAVGLFGHKYGEMVKVYGMGDFSLEICAGPHVKNTSELGKFKIVKEQSSSAGVRRIKAILE